MHPELLRQTFAARLNTTLKNKNLRSNRAHNGVCAKKLAEVSDCSYQMARKYTNGLAMPEYATTLAIANWLEVSPGWLAFGEEPGETRSTITEDTILASLDLIREIIHQALICSQTITDLNDFTDFVVSVLQDVHKMKADKNTVFKMTELAIKSYHYESAQAKMKRSS